MRMNIVIDDNLLERAMRVTGAKTKREAVELGLASLVRLKLAAARDALSRLPSFDLLGRERVDRTADRCRELRASGVAPRKTVDVVIGSLVSAIP